MNVINIDCEKIDSWEAFHRYFKSVMGFPDFYGNNMAAWIDCMSYLDEDDGMTTIKIEKGAALTLQLDHATGFAANYPEMFNALTDAAAFVNYRRTAAGEPPLIALSYYK